jgi:hypothetical protein
VFLSSQNCGRKVSHYIFFIQVFYFFSSARRFNYPMQQNYESVQRTAFPASQKSFPDALKRFGRRKIAIEDPRSSQIPEYTPEERGGGAQTSGIDGVVEMMLPNPSSAGGSSPSTYTNPDLMILAGGR